jgi:hypothetical protein
VADAARVTLIGKPGCHLCQDARAVVEQVCAEVGTGWQEISILDDGQLAEEYGEQIPVVLVDGARHSYFRVEPEALRDALAGRRPWRLRPRTGG